jgi:hypothetical protein
MILFGTRARVQQQITTQGASQTVFTLVLCSYVRSTAVLIVMGSPKALPPNTVLLASGQRSVI